MGRTAVAFGTPESRPSVMDRLACGPLFASQEPGRDSSDSIARTAPALPDATKCEEPGSFENELIQETEMILPRLWLELSLPERERFGCCFSSLVLKALGLRACPTQEVER